MESLKQMLKNLPLVALASIIIFAVYMAYFFLIGVPRTQARFFYNQGIIALESNDKVAAKDDFTKAFNYWPEGYIQSELDKLI